MNYKEQYKMASKSMQEAVNAFNKGKLKEARSLRDKAYQLFEDADREMDFYVKDDNALYGPNRNFGIIYHVFESNMDKLLSTKDGRAVIKEFTKKIKGSDVLTEEYKIYNTLCESKNVNAAEFYVNEMVEVFPSFSRKGLKNLHESLLGTLRKVEIDEMVDIPSEALQLYEAIEYLMLNKAKMANIEEIANSKHIIKEHISAVDEEPNLEESTEEENKETEDENVDDGLKFDGSELSESEKKIIDEYSKCNDKEGMFNSYKKQVLSAVNTAKNLDEDKERWNATYNKLNEMKYDSNDLFNITLMGKIMNALIE